MRKFDVTVNCFNNYDSIKISDASTSAYDTPSLPALKLLRVMASRDKVLAKEIATKFYIFHAVSSYITTDIGKNITGMKIQTESLNILAVYLSYCLKLDVYK